MLFAVACGGTKPEIVTQAPPVPRAVAKPVAMPEAWNRWRPIPWEASPAPLPEGAKLPVDPAAILTFAGASRTLANLSPHDRERLTRDGLRRVGTQEMSLSEGFLEPLGRGAPILLTIDGVGMIAATALGRALLEARTRIVESELPALLTRLRVALGEDLASAPPRADGHSCGPGKPGIPSVCEPPSNLVAAFATARAYLSVPRILIAPNTPMERDIAPLVSAELARLRARPASAQSVFGGAFLDGEALPAAKSGPASSAGEPDPALALAWLATIRLDLQAVGEGGVVSVDEARRNARVAILLLRALRHDPEAAASALRCDRVFAFSEGVSIGAGLTDLATLAEEEGLLAGDLTRAADVVVIDRFRKKFSDLALRRDETNKDPLENGAIARRRSSTAPAGFGLFAPRAFFDASALTMLAKQEAETQPGSLLYVPAFVSQNSAPLLRTAFPFEAPLLGRLADLRPADDADARHASAWGSWLSTTLAAAAVPKSLSAQPFSATPLFAARRADAAAALWLAGRLAGRLAPPAFPSLPLPSVEAPPQTARLVVVEPDPETFVAFAATIGQVRASLAAALPADARDPVFFAQLGELEETLTVVAQGSVAATSGIAVDAPNEEQLLRAPARLARLAERLGVDALAKERMVLFRDHVAKKVHVARIGGARKLVVVAWDRTVQKPILAEGPIFVPSAATVVNGEASFREAELAKAYSD